MGTNIELDEVLSKIKRDKDFLGIKLYGNASETDITSFENTIGVILPPDFKSFYRFCNGFESNEDMFRMIPLNEILENRASMNRNYLVKKSDFHFAEYMIYCDMWTLTISVQSDSNYSIYNKAENVVTLTNSLSLFLDKFLTGGVFDGLYKWRESK